MKVVILGSGMTYMVRELVNNRCCVVIFESPLTFNEKLKKHYKIFKRNLASLYLEMFLRPDILLRVKYQRMKERAKLSREDKKVPVRQFKSYTVKNFNSEECEKILEKEKPDVIVVIGTLTIIKPNIFKKAKKGCIHIHHGLLPHWRGTDIPFWVLYENKQAGFTIHYIDEGIDTGDIIYKEKVESKPDDTPLSLRRRIETVAAKALLEILHQFETKIPKGIKQKFKGDLHTSPTAGDIFELEKRLIKRRILI